MMGLSVGHHERVPTGVTVSRLTSDFEALRQLVTDGITTLVVQGLTFVGVIVILFSYDWKLALVAFAVFPVPRAGDGGLSRDIGGAYRRTREKVANVLAALQETIRGSVWSRGSVGKSPPPRRSARSTRSTAKRNMRTIRISASYFPAVEFLTAIGTAMVLMFGGGGCSTAPSPSACSSPFWDTWSCSSTPIQQLSQLYGTFQSAMAALEKTLGVLEDLSQRWSTGPGATDLPAISGAIALRDVTFGYLEGTGSQRRQPRDPGWARRWRRRPERRGQSPRWPRSSRASTTPTTAPS